MRIVIFLLFGLLLHDRSHAQQYSVSSIPDELLKNAKAIVRLDETHLTLESIDKLLVERTHIVTILKNDGDYYRYLPMHYDKQTKIKSYSGEVLDAQGNSIKEFKKKDYKDYSSSGSSTLYADDRVLIYDYTPTQYPYTIKYQYTYETSNTAFVPNWTPVNSYNIGIEENKYSLQNNSGIEIKTKEFLIKENQQISFEKTANGFIYVLNNFSPLEQESLSPNLSEIVPQVWVTPNKFQLVGYNGASSTWEEFGKWMYHDLIIGRQELPESEIIKVKELTKNATTQEEKIRILYQYMQEKTRYINVAIGIGGWQPYPAEYVSTKGYGDCKALTNYMMSLLDAVGIKSNYTVVYGDSNNPRDIQPDFPAMQGNHVILHVPMENDTIWLECTSQKTAFNHLGNFTSDRYALSITEKGGEIIRTQSFPSEKNKEIISGIGKINLDGSLDMQLSNKTTGIQYDWNYYVYYYDQTDQKQWLQDKFSAIINRKIESYDFKNNQNEGTFEQNVQLSSDIYAQKTGNNLIFPILPAGSFSTELKKNSNRKQNLKIAHGFQDEATFQITVPIGYTVNYDLEPIKINSEFGEYSLHYSFEDGKVNVQRKLITQKGEFPKEKYLAYVEFRRAIEKADNTKILLEKK